MRKFLLSAIALLMTISVMAIGKGDGSSEVNAFDFDWVDGHEHQADTTKWYRVGLDSISGLVDPTLALYLTNTSNAPATVTVEVNAKVSFSLPIPGFAAVEKDTTFSKEYTIGAKGYDLWSQNVKDLLKLNVTYLNLKLHSTQTIRLSAKKYETSDIVDDACTKAKDFDWTGVEVQAGETWYRLNLTEVADDKELNFVVANNGLDQAKVRFDLSLDCPASTVWSYDWTIAAGGEKIEEFGRVFLNVLKEDYVFLKLTTDEALELRVEEKPAPPALNETWVVNDVLAEGVEYTFKGEHVFFVDLATLSAPLGDKVEFFVTNNEADAATVTKQISFENPVGTTIDKTLVVDGGATVTKDVVNQMTGVITSKVAYIRFTSDKEVTVQLKYIEVNAEIKNEKPIVVSTCENSELLNWNSTVRQSGLETRWYEIDLASIKNNGQHLQLSFTNKTENVVVIMGEILAKCGGKDTIPYILPVQAGETISQTINYNLFAMLPHPKHFFVSATVIPTTATSLLDLKDIRSKDDIMALVPQDLEKIQAAEVELVANAVSASVDPTDCNKAVTIARGVKYEQAAGTTKWYRVTDELMNKLSLFPDVAFINNGKKAANVTIAAGVSCEYATFGMSTISVPTWADLTMFPSRLVGNLMDKAFNSDVKEMYLQVTTDQPIAFGIDINYGFGLGCDDARKFNWETGAVVMPGDAQWLDFDITSVKNNQQQVKLTLTNESNSLAWVGMMVSLTCPFKVALPTFFAIPAGMSIDKVVDYSYFASTKLDQLYIALITEEKITVKAEAMKATASASDYAACEKAVEVKNGEAYVHNAGTTWYKFDREMFSDVSRLPKFRYAAEGTTSLTFGATVGCEYNIATKGTIKLPTTKGLEVSFRMPGFIYVIMDKFVNKEVTEFYLELTTDKQIKFGMDMEYAGGCEKASALNFEDEIAIDLIAGKDAWYQIDLNKLAAMGDEMINLNLNNPSDKAVEVEFEVSPTCPLLISAIKSVSVPANTNLPIAFPASTITKLYDEVVEHLNVPEKITNNLPNALKDDMVYYVRVRANGDLHIDNEDNTIERPEGCEFAKELDLSKTINLSDIKTGWYHVDLTPLKNGSINKVSINNDLGKDTGVKFDFFRNCDEARSFYAYTHLFRVGLFEQSVPSYALSLIGGINELYIYITMDVDVLTCDDAIEFDWSKGAVHNAGDTQWYHFDITSVEENEQQVKLTFTNHSEELAVIYGEVAMHCPYTYSIPYACVVPGGMSIDKVVDYSVFKASRVEELYVKVYSTKTIELAASTESALVFDNAPCANATLIKTGGEYTHSAGTAWYHVPAELFKNTGKLPKFYFTTEEEGWTTITLGATVGCEYKIATKTIAKVPGSLNYAMVMPEQMFDLMDKFVSDEVTDVYVELTTNRAVSFSVDMINNTDDACHGAEMLDIDKGINLVANQEKWYKIDLDVLKAMNSDVAMTVINPSANDVTVDMELSPTCPVVISLNKSLNIPGAQELTKIISKSKIDKIPGVSFYVNFKATEDVQIVFSKPELPDDIEACKDAVALDWHNTINLSELNPVPGWYKFDLTEIQKDKKDLVLTINNDLGRSIYLGLKLYETCETGSFYNLSDSVGEGSFVKVTTYDKINQAIGESLELYAYITIDTVKVPVVLVEDCEEAVEYTWNSDLSLSAGDAKWYKLSMIELRGKTCDITLTANNATADTVRADIVMHEACPVSAENQIVSMEDLAIMPNSNMVKTVSSDDLPTDVDTIYMHVVTTGAVTVNMSLECLVPPTPPVLEYAYDTIYSYGCEAAMSNDTVHVSAVLDSVYTYVVTKFEAPVVMTDSILATIAYATPELKHNTTPDMTASADAIEAYYKGLDTEAIADVVAVEWTPVTKVECGATTYTISLVVVDNCGDTLKTTHAFDVAPKAPSAVESAIICAGEVYPWYGINYDTTGIYTKTLTAKDGCDSIVTLDLLVMPEIRMTIDTTVCGSLKWDGNVYDSTGVYEELYIANSGCDSIIELNVTVLKPSVVDTTIAELVCDGTEYVDSITGKKHIISSLIPSTQAWNDTIVSECAISIYKFRITPIVAPEVMTDSILTFINAIPVLVQGEKPQVDASIAAIQAYYAGKDNDTISDVSNVTWSNINDVLDCDATTHAMTLTVEAGCDNVLSMPFVFDVQKRVITPNEVTIIKNCGDPYVWDNGKTYSESGRYMDTVRTSFGCDSLIRILNLTINPAPDTIVIGTTICYGGSVVGWPEVDATIVGDSIYECTLPNVDGCDSTTILKVIVLPAVEYAPEEKATICFGGSYQWRGQERTSNANDTLRNSLGCDSIIYTLNLTVLPETVTENETLTICESEFPYEWRGMTLDSVGTYTVVEQYIAASCDSVIHVLELQTYVMTLPVNVTEPIAICGNPVDVADATADIETHIDTTNLYAPNAVVEWYINNNGNWTLLTNDSIKGGLNDITLRYVITSDCGTIESETFTVTIEVIENGVDVDDVLAVSKYENRIFLLHLNDFVDNYGWTPAPEEVTWYKVVNDKDQDVIYDDIQVGKGHSYNELDGSVIKPGEYYALIISNEMVDPDDCDGQIIMRTITLSSGKEALSPKLISNVVRPNDNLRLINLDSEEVTEIFVYNMMGELIDTYMVDQASEFIFNANHVSGYYLIDVKTANNKTTLRYIVK